MAVLFDPLQPGAIAMGKAPVGGGAISDLLRPRSARGWHDTPKNVAAVAFPVGLTVTYFKGGSLAVNGGRAAEPRQVQFMQASSSDAKPSPSRTGDHHALRHHR